MSSVTFPFAFLLGVFLQTLLVGIFIPLFLVASYAQWNRVSRGQKVNLVMAFTTVFFGLVIPVHWILSIRRAIVAALYLPPGLTIEQYLEPPYDASEITRWAIFQFSIVVGDLVMVYRMYHIYDKSIIACVIPSITTSGLMVIACGLTNQLRSLKTRSEFTSYNQWATACFCVTLFNSAFMSIAICLRLWKIHRETALAGINFGTTSLTLRAMKVLVESAALWTFFVSMNFLTFLANNNLSYTFLDMTNPAVGISFCLIIVRLGTTAPEIRDGSWESSERIRPSRFGSDSRLSRLSVPLDHIKVERDVYVSDAESGTHFHVSPAPSIEKPEAVH